MRVSFRRCFQWITCIFLCTCMLYLLKGDRNVPLEQHAFEVGKLFEKIRAKQYGALESNKQPVANDINVRQVSYASRNRNQRSAKSFLWLGKETLPKDGVDHMRSFFKKQSELFKKGIVGLGNAKMSWPLNNARAVNNDPHRKTELEDVFISMKSTKENHKSRLSILIETWMSIARDQTYIFTDTDDEELASMLPENHLINTNCSTSHFRQDLCCKMAKEYDYFMTSQKRWFCHVDDDTYLNVPKLVLLLQKYNHSESWYIGKPSIRHPIEIIDRRNGNQKVAFWFATGGAGFCLSRGLGLKMMPYTAGGRIMTVGESIRLPDDCTLGYIINHMLKVKLTTVETFHSHLESLKRVKIPNDQLTFSYLGTNVVDVAGFSLEKDPTRFKSIHCKLYPHLDMCYELKV